MWVHLYDTLSACLRHNLRASIPSQEKSCKGNWQLHMADRSFVVPHECIMLTDSPKWVPYLSSTSQHPVPVCSDGYVYDYILPIYFGL